jgi:DNA-binding response OmpR family regulator
MQPDFKIARKRLLIIDDDRELLELLTGFLQSCGFEVQTDENADNIFEIIQGFRPDLIILDYLLPRINGGEICSQIKKSGSLKHIPVIIYSAYSRVFLSLGNYGSDSFIAKPFDLSHFTSEVERLCWPAPFSCSKYGAKSLSNHY